MKAQILNTEGKKIKEITTNLFEEPIRIDIIRKVIEAERIKQPYAPKYLAGMNRSPGNARHKRHSWKSDRGKGMSRYPKKIMWRRGTQFSWVATMIPSARSGRRAHPPKVLTRIKKINKKELKKALLSSLSYVNSAEELKKKYFRLEDRKIEAKFPLVVEGKLLNLQTKEIFESLKKILGELYVVALQKKSVRAGIGKLRGRKNKKNAGLLFVIGNSEKMKIKGFEVLKVKELKVSDLAENGARLTIFSEGSIKDLENKIGGKK